MPKVECMAEEGEEEEEEMKRNYLVCTKSLNWFSCTQEKRNLRVKSFLLFRLHLPCLYDSIPFLSPSSSSSSLI